MLGSALVPALVNAGHEVVATDIDLEVLRPWGDEGPALGPLDVRVEADVAEAFSVHDPEFVAHLAAETDLETCERRPDEAYATNTAGTRIVASACKRAGVPLAYISTGGVFDGEKVDPYTEEDRPNPINVYGVTKLEGEHEVRRILDRAFIIRAGWMVGGGPKDHKFVAKILSQLKAGSRTLHVVTDKFGTPTYAPDFAECFAKLMTTDAYDLYHMVCEGRGTRYDVCAHLLDVLGIQDRVELIPVDSTYFAETYFAPRPRSEIMRNLHLEALGLNTMRPWRAALHEYVTTRFTDIQIP